MSTCGGDGECLNQCMCECENNICECGHREHKGYCPSDCCQPVLCRTCKEKLVLWVANCHNGLCENCAAQQGPHKVLSDNRILDGECNRILDEECCIYYEKNTIIILKCQHNICSDCWFRISEEYTPKCPLCRNNNIW